MRKQTVYENKNNQYHNPVPKLHRFEENHYHQPRAPHSYPVPYNAYNQRGNYETSFSRGWDPLTRSSKNPSPVFLTADPLAHCQSQTSSVSNMSLSPSQRLAHSSDRCRCSEAGSKVYCGDNSCQERDIWYETESVNQHQRDDLRGKNQLINQLLSKEEKQRKQIVELEKRLKEAISNKIEQTCLLREERRERLKAEENHAMGMKSFRLMSNNLQSKNSVLKQKHKKLIGENKMLKGELQLTKDKLKYSEGLIRKQNRQLSGWGNEFNVRSWEARRKNELSGAEGHVEVNSLSGVVPEGQDLVILGDLLPRDLLSLSKEEGYVEKVVLNKQGDGLVSNKQMPPIHHLRDKPPLQKIFEPGRMLLNTDFKNIEMSELVDSQSSKSDRYYPLNKEVDFWMRPEPPDVIDAEKVVVGLVEVSQDNRTNDSQTQRAS